jgi:hypothetical protein
MELHVQRVFKVNTLILSTVPVHNFYTEHISTAVSTLLFDRTQEKTLPANYDTCVVIDGRHVWFVISREVDDSELPAARI